MIIPIVAGCSSQSSEIAASSPDAARSAEVAAQRKAHLTSLFEQSYSVCARAYPEGRLLDLSLDPQPAPRDEVSNRIRLAQSGVWLWNGMPINLEQLRQFLDLTVAMTPQPLLVVEVEKGAPKTFVQDLHEVIIRTQICPSRKKNIT
jgi:hypothetical protein